MKNLSHDDLDNTVNFIKQNCPVTPPCRCNLEQKLMQSISEQPQDKTKESSKLILIIPSAIATGLLFTAIGVGLKSPQVAIESAELENFIVNSWNDTITSDSYTFLNEAESYWLVPASSETQATLTLSTP